MKKMVPHDLMILVYFFYLLYFFYPHLPYYLIFGFKKSMKQTYFLSKFKGMEKGWVGRNISDKKKKISFSFGNDVLFTDGCVVKSGVVYDKVRKEKKRMTTPKQEMFST